jgi:isoprenylcysteine carboxyl methyltransferase (ICMT) family protein YpbQ
MRDIQIYAAIIGLTWLAFLISWAILAMTIGGSGRRYYSPAASGARLVIVVLLFLAVRYNGWVDVQPFGDRARDVAAAGTALCVAGFAFALWARIALGRNWGMPMTLHENPQLVTVGPYRLVRHPIYTGLSGMLIGTTLVYPLAALPCAIAIGYSVLSALREERDMEQRFPAAYPDYRKRSKMLVPFLF